MNLVFRLFRVLLAAFFAPRLAPDGASVLRLRIWPNDLDFNFHVNNGRYLTLMDLGRIDMLVRQGMVPVMFKKRWQPVIGAAVIRFRRPMKVFQAFTLKTRVIGWDAKWFYFEQVFESRGEMIARARVRGAFVGPQGVVSTSDYLHMSGWEAGSPLSLAELENWLRVDEALNPAA